MRYLAFCLIILLPSCSSHKNYEFPLGLNSEMTPTDVEKKLKVRLEKLAGQSVDMENFTLDKPATIITYQLKKDFEIDYLKFKDLLLSFDKSHGMRLNEVQFQESNMKVIFDPAEECLELKRNWRKKGIAI